MYPVSLEELINEFEKLPGIGHKSAVRLAFHVMNMPEAKVDKFIGAINKAKTKVSEPYGQASLRCLRITKA